MKKIIFFYCAGIFLISCTNITSNGFRAKSDMYGVIRVDTSVKEIYIEGRLPIRYLREVTLNNCIEMYDMSNHHIATFCRDMGEVAGSKLYLTFSNFPE